MLVIPDRHTSSTPEATASRRRQRTRLDQRTFARAGAVLFLQLHICFQSLASYCSLLFYQRFLHAAFCVQPGRLSMDAQSSACGHFDQSFIDALKGAVFFADTYLCAYIPSLSMQFVHDSEAPPFRYQHPTQEDRTMVRPISGVPTAMPCFGMVKGSAANPRAMHLGWCTMVAVKVVKLLYLHSCTVQSL